MNANQVRELIEQENAARTREAMEQARQLINRIAELQQAKASADEQIAAAREELRKLSAATIAETDIIGGF